MLIPPIPLQPHGLSFRAVSADLQAAQRFGPCALGKKLLYLGGYFPRTRALPLGEVMRVYKRLAVGRGFYEGKVYGTLCYLVVQSSRRRPHHSSSTCPHRPFPRGKPTLPCPILTSCPTSRSSTE